MKHASLFSGIGGFDLASEHIGWENMFWCEKNEFCRKILAYHFPNSSRYGDIKTTKFDEWCGKIDILTGGFPCQPFSTAGLRKGTDDDRYLWDEMLRAIREIKPRWVVGENVRGIISWSNGLVFEQVCSDLEIEGYKVQPFLLPAAGVNAPHQRYRVWFIAHANSIRYSRGESEQCNDTERKFLSGEFQRCEMGCKTERCCRKQVVANTTSKRLERDINSRKQKEERYFYEFWKHIAGFCESGNITDTTSSRWMQNYQEFTSEQLKQNIPNWEEFPTQSPVCCRNDGISSLLDGITFPKWRSESIKAYGNAIVWKIAYKLFQAIDEFENQLSKQS